LIGLTFDRPLETVVCLGAHPDDIEIGAAGTLRRLADRHSDARFTFVVLTGDQRRRVEAEESMRSLLGNRATLHMGTFRDGYLPYEDPAAVKDFLKQISDLSAAQVVFAPNEWDRHQDHSFVARLTNQILRDHFVLGYEVVKYDGGLGSPQVFVALTADEAQAKEEHLASHFASQQTKHWYTSDGFRALMRIRGIESNSPSGFAEAFYVAKLVLE